MSNIKINSLVNQILKHKKLYYEGKPIIKDEEYDALEDELRDLDPNNPILFLVGSPIDAVSNKVAKYTHTIPMLSCQKTHTTDKIVSWAKNNTLLVGYKIDGFALSLIYKKGRLVFATTRGNGSHGDDTTIEVMKIPAIPKTLPFEDLNVIIRGEIFMPISELNRINEEEETNYTSPRNLAVGTIKQSNLALLESRKLRFFAYELLNYNDTLSYSQLQTTLKRWNFEVPDFESIIKPTKENLDNLFAEIIKKRPALDFEVDGIVFKYNDASARNEAGFTSHHPRWSIALKFPNQGKPAKVLKIIWQLGRYGQLAPVGIIEPTEILGAVVRRVTFHNAEFIETKDIAVGDTIMMVRSGDVIPKVTEVLTKGNSHYKLPTQCPSCNSPLRRESVQLYCTGTVCKDRLIKSIRHGVKRTEILLLGLKNIEKLYEAKKIKIFADLFDLSKVELISVLGKNGSKIYESIQSKKSLPFHIFLATLGIDSLGRSMSKLMAKHFSTLENLQKATIQELTQLEGLSTISATNIQQGINDPTKSTLLLSKGIKIIYPKEVKTMTNESKEIVYITGKIQGMNKEQAKEKIEEAGYIASEKFNKKVTLLLTGERAGGAKIAKAQKWAIPIKKWDDLFG